MIIKNKLLIIALTSFCNFLFAQTHIPNFGFELGDKNSITQTAYWKPESDNFYCKVDNKEFYSGSKSLKLESKTEGHHFFKQDFEFITTGLTKYKLKCAVKTKNLKGKLQLGARVLDSAGLTLTKMIFDLTEDTNTNWMNSEGIVIAEKYATKIRIFGNLFGTGEAWFDEITLEEIPKPTREPSPNVAMYIHEYFDIVYENSIISDKTQISKLKSKTMYLCAENTSMNDCVHILKHYTTNKLGDNHSFYTTSKEWKEMMEMGKHPNTGNILHEMPSGKFLEDNVAYIKLPMFVSSDQKLLYKYADTLQYLIAEFDKKSPTGWIIDLSKNGGGNCFPMIAGLGPLIGNGICEYSFSGDGSIRKIIYNDGWTGRDSTMVLLKTNPYFLKKPNRPIAVIYGNGTGSAGEVVAIAFIGLPNTKSFGLETHGNCTRVDNFEMSDGAYLNLASGINADRNKIKYNGKIKPDTETKDTETAISEAIKWIKHN